MMTLQDLKSMYPPPPIRVKEGRDGKVERSKATLKNHRHVVNQVWLPGKPSVSPAVFRRKHLGKKKKGK